MDRRGRTHRHSPRHRTQASSRRRMLDPVVRAGLDAEHRQYRERPHIARTRASLRGFYSATICALLVVCLIPMELTVYSAFWCPECREAKRFLAKHNIPYKDIDIETTPGAAEEIVKHTGKRAIPQFVIDGEWVQPYRLGEGFLYEEMSERLGIKSP